MKKSILFFLAAVSVIAASCTKTIEKGINDGESVVYGKDAIVAVAEVPVSATKTEIGNDQKSVLWTAGDSFTLVSSDGKVSKFTISSGIGTTNGTFTGDIKGNAPYYAVYPYSDGVTIDDGNVIFSTSKVVKGKAGNITPGVSPSFAKMEKSGDKLYFKNTGSLLCLPLCGSCKVKRLALHDLQGNMMWGRCAVDTQAEDPVAEVTEGDNTIIMEYADPVQLSGTPVNFYIAVPAGSFGHGFSVVLYEEHEPKEWEKEKQMVAYSFLQSAWSSTVKRSALLKMPQIKVEENSESANVKARGYYKDLFMDGGIHLTSRTTLPAATFLGLSMEYFASNSHGSGDDDEGEPDPGKLTATDTIVQRDLYQGSKGDDTYVPYEDENGIFMYPDGEPRFRSIYMNGGKSKFHGRSLEENGRQRYRDYMANGGTYVGTCAGAFMTCNARSKSSVKKQPENNTAFLHIWPGYTSYLIREYYDDASGKNIEESAIKKFRHSAYISPGCGILRYFDFGGDGLIEAIRHEGGAYMIDDNTTYCPVPDGTEVLLQYRFLPELQDPVKGDTSKMNTRPCAWSYRDPLNPKSGRLIACGSHPEGFTDNPADGIDCNPETLRLMASFLLYIGDETGDIETKGELVAGEARVMDKKTGDKEPEFARIGDRQYHHFTIDVPDTDNGAKISLTCNVPGVDMYLALRKGDYAWISDAEYVLIGKGGNKTLCTRKLEPGKWYVSVMCATAPTSTRRSYPGNGGGTAYYYKYSGNTEVLNGIPYILKYSLINPDGSDRSGSTDTQVMDYVEGSWVE